MRKPRRSSSLRGTQPSKTGRKARPSGDPALKTYAWGKIKAYWRKPQNRQNCARCGGTIDYEGTFYIPHPIHGGRVKNPRYLHVGHIVGRDEGRRMGWTEEQIMHISNTQPECATCSNSSGAQYGNKIRRPLNAVPTIKVRTTLDKSREW